MRFAAKRCALLAVTAASLLAAVPSAHAGVTIGSSLTNSADDYTCGIGQADTTISCTVAQRSLPAGALAPDGMTAPFDGIVTGWNVRVGPTNIYTSSSAAALAVMSGNTITAASNVQYLPMTLGDNIYNYPVRLPIGAGNRIGLSISTTSNSAAGGGSNAGITPVIHDGPGNFDFWYGQPNSSPSDIGAEVLVNARIEPDLDQDGLIDGVEDQCPTDAKKSLPCPKDTTLPVVSAASASNRIFRVDSGGVAARVQAPRGTVFRYVLSEPSTVTFTIDRKFRGRKSKGKCKAGAKKGKRCRGFKTAGVFTRAGAGGSNQSSFSGKIGKGKLRAASYRVQVIAADESGNKSKPAFINVKVVK